jgi:hypothetical protein
MAITFQSYTQAQGFTVSSLTPSLPTNATGQVMLALLNLTGASSTPVITTPAGWTLIIDSGVFGIGVKRAAYYKLGDGSTGTVLWAFDQTIRGNVDILVYDGINTASPIDTSSFKNDTGTTTSHLTTDLTTAQANAMLVVMWATADTGISFSDSTDVPNTRVNLAGTTGSAERPTLIADAIQAVAGAAGVKTATTNSGSQGQAIAVALKPAPNPSVPVLTYPNGGESLTAGAVVNITWTASTSPTADQASLKYNLDYSANFGSSWTSIVALTSAGVTTYAWTVPATAGAGYLVRIRSNDPALALYSLAYDLSDNPFTVVAETAPGVPIITAPTAGSANNKAVNVTVSWTHQGGPGNPQVAFTLQWANNAAFTSPTTVGPTTTGTQSTSIDFSAQAHGTTIYVKVKTQGVSLYSEYSSIRSFIVASLPATPNITAPTAGSPPTVPLPSITFTEADTFVSRKIRITQGGTEVYNSGDVVSTALSFTSPYSFANSTAYVLYLSVKNVYGLASAEDSETFTASYAGPATPTLTATAVSEAGHVLLQITNSDTPTYNELWRYLSTAAASTAIKIGAGLPKNASFSDYHPVSGLTYKYFARAYASTGLFTDSTVSSSVGVTLPNLFIHAVSRTSTSGNTDEGAISLLNTEGQWRPEETRTAVNLLGRTNPVALLGQAVGQRLSVVAVVIPYSQIELLLALWRKQKTGAVICVRDQSGNRIFGRMAEPRVQDQSSYLLVTFEVVETATVEGL